MAFAQHNLAPAKPSYWGIRSYSWACSSGWTLFFLVEQVVVGIHYIRVRVRARIHIHILIVG